MTDAEFSTPPDHQEQAARLVAACNKIREQVSRIVVGQEDVVEQLVIAILARGH